ncbi:ROK family transcriptional regulator [Jannaschia marina]|uniref:ROK family transcriptional regulator n=1 Tax=Jannaschia marina TaxID=2741674 RepID=UPI0015CAD553|nr:ROK family transcriptional regulator [Jannaschia marina]
MDGRVGPQGVEAEASGANQAGAADHNARLVLTTLRGAGALPGAEIARRTRLTAQAVSIILRRLEAEGLVERGAALRGRAGKPRIPVSLAPGGAWAMGLKVGRRSAALANVDLTGRIVARRDIGWSAPSPQELAAFLDASVPALLSEMPVPPCGAAVAMPYQLWAWHGSVPAHPRAAWEALDLRNHFAGLVGAPVDLRNDMTCAARAEVAWGPERAEKDWAYLHVGALVGGGIVLDGRVRDGRRGNAGAFGPLHVRGRDGAIVQLLEVASLWHLEDSIGRNLSTFDWSLEDARLAVWLERASDGIARAIADACAVLDFEGVVVDGLFPPPVRAALTGMIRARLAERDMRGLYLPTVSEGEIGRDARVLGAATVAFERALFLA